jgi:hypothetical protein
MHLVEAFLVGLELVGLERGVDQQLGLLRQRGAGGQAQRNGGGERKCGKSHGDS